LASGLPRVEGLDHDGTEGRAYRRYVLDLVTRLGLSMPLPGWAIPALREAGQAHLTLARLTGQLEAEHARPEPRQQEQRRLRSELRRSRSQRLVQERVLAAG